MSNAAQGTEMQALKVKGYYLGDAELYLAFKSGQCAPVETLAQVC